MDSIAHALAGLHGKPPLAWPSEGALLQKSPAMLLIMLEALAAGCLLVLIVWWTMFAGRNKGERKESDDNDDAP